VVLTREGSLAEQNYKIKLASGETNYRLSIVVNQGSSSCGTCVVSVGIVQLGENPQVIQTGDSVTITGSGSSYQKEKVLDVLLGPGEYVLMIDGKPTPSRITVMS